jgi:hypothetical protein
LEDAQVVYSMTQAFSSTPAAGGVMDQPVWVLRMLAVLEAGGHFGDRAASSSSDPTIPMELL